MKNGIEFKQYIKSIFEEVRKEYPNVTNDMLCENGAIYYMNGNDSTPFDWSANDRLCEFGMYHKDGAGFIKALVNKNGSVNVYVYENGEIFPTQKLCCFIDTEETSMLFLANLMNNIADRQSMWNKNINDLDWEKDCTNEWYISDDYDYFEDEEECEDCESLEEE